MNKAMKILMFAMALGATGLTFPAHAEDMKQVNERMKVIEQSLADLQAAWRQQGADVASRMSAVDQIREDWNAFQGTVDAISQQQQLLFDQLRKYIDEFEARLQKIEERVALGTVEDTTDEAIATAPVAPEATATPTAEAVAAKSPTNAYQEGLNTVRDRRYPEAVELFRNFLRTNAQHALAEKAQFWIAECYYAMGDFKQAVDEYNIHIMRYPNSGKLAASLFRKANAFAELGKMHEAQQTFRDLIAKAPNSKEAKHASNQLQAIMNATAVRTTP